MFKQASIYKITGVNPSTLDADLKAQTFIPCGASQEKSVGWVPPRGHEHGPMVETIGGQTIIKLMIETKSVPGDAVRRATDERVKLIEAETGRKPGKKERRDIMDDVLLSMLPNAFAKQATVTGWITNDGLLIVDSTSQGRTDEFMSALINATEGVNVRLIQTVTSPQAAMTQWLLAETADEWPDNLNVERECVLQSIGEDAATVKFNRHHLANNDVRKHVLEGKLPTALALSWDGRMAFVLTDTLKLKKLQYLDGVESHGDQHEDRFDADVALATGNLRLLIEDLVYALGGDMDAQEGGAE
jgi:recombination associated protein RdgC